jgi:hypothetical protein
MSMKTMAVTVLGGAAVGAALLVAAPTAGADPGQPQPPGCDSAGNCANWGQTVKNANQTPDAYGPNDASRGSFVSGAAGSNPNGFATNIHNPTLNATPGNSNPTNKNFG